MELAHADGGGGAVRPLPDLLEELLVGHLRVEDVVFVVDPVQGIGQGQDGESQLGDLLCRQVAAAVRQDDIIPHQSASFLGLARLLLSSAGPVSPRSCCRSLR